MSLNCYIKFGNCSFSGVELTEQCQSDSYKYNLSFAQGQVPPGQSQGPGRETGSSREVLWGATSVWDPVQERGETQTSQQAIRAVEVHLLSDCLLFLTETQETLLKLLPSAVCLFYLFLFNCRWTVLSNNFN